MSNTRKVDPDEFRRLVAAGASGADIRKAFGITTTTFTYWRNKLGVGPVWWRRCDPARVRAMVGDGKTDRQIAGELGCGVDRVLKTRKRLGLAPNDGRATAEYKAAQSELMKRRAASGDIHARRRESFAAGRTALCERFRLPGSLLPAQVQIVVTLATSGPMQVNALADRLGRSPNANGYVRFAYPHAAGGNLLTALRKLGLIFSVRTGTGALYSLTPHCLDLLASATTYDTRRTDSGRETSGEADGSQTQDPAGR